MINLLKEEIHIGEIICQKCSQTTVESDLIVPDVKPDIKKVLEVSGNACITQKYIQQDKVYIQGLACLTVLYVPDGEALGKVKSLSVSKEFTHTIDCRGAMPDMQLTVEAVPESFDYTLVNCRKLNLRCVISINTKVVNPSAISLTTDVEDNPNIALKKERLRIINGTDTAECKIILREQLELPSGKPAISEILKITAIPSSTDLCMMDNKAVAKGQVCICILYNAEDENNSVQFMEYNLPFTEIIDADGVSEDMEGEIEYSVADMYHEIRDDDDGEARNIGVEIVLNASVKGSEVTETEAVTDAYCLNSGLDLSAKTYKIEQLLDNSTAEISHRDTAQLPDMLPTIHQIYSVNSRAAVDQITVSDGEINVHGTVHTNILFLSDDENTPVSGFKHISEFTHVFSVVSAGNSTVCDARAFMNHVSYTLNGDNSIDFRFVIGLTVKSLDAKDTVIVEDMSTFIPETGINRPCITIYFVQPDDTLWDIAKRYRTTVEDIKRINNLDSDLIVSGQQIKIMPL